MDKINTKTEYEKYIEKIDDINAAIDRNEAIDAGILEKLIDLVYNYEVENNLPLSNFKF